MNDDEKPPLKHPPAPVVPTMSRNQRRMLKKERLKLIPGGKRPDAPTVDTTQPAGRFALALHTFMIQYLAANADLEPTALCAAALQVSSAFALDAGGNVEDFAKAAEYFFAGEEEARKRGRGDAG